MIKKEKVIAYKEEAMTRGRGSTRGRRSRRRKRWQDLEGPTMPMQKMVKSRNQGRSVQLRSSSGLHSLFVL